jgi:hypothetical protein
LKKGDTQMKKQFNDNGMAIINVMGTEGKVETYDLGNCLDIWGRGIALMGKKLVRGQS